VSRPPRNTILITCVACVLVWGSFGKASEPFRKAQGNRDPDSLELRFDSLKAFQAPNQAPQKIEEVLTPLTDEERLLNTRQLMLDQPDFVADVGFFQADFVNGAAIGGLSFAEKVAVKGNRFREESQYWVFVGEIGKTAVRLDPRNKVYDDLLPSRGDGSASGVPYPKMLAADANIVFTALGTTPINGHKCIKIEAAQEGKPVKIYFYAAPDLKNLVIASVLISPQRQVRQSLNNISLDIADGLVQIPPDYSAIPHDRWTKVESAKVTYKGQPSNNFGVFRAPGGELFIWVQDAYYPWDYLYRPQQKIVEVAFQGLLVNRSGEFIWKTTNTEAFSLPAYRIPNDKAHTEHVDVQENLIKFHSFSYERDNATIEVSW
jgi:hypothetical protein